MKELTNLCNLSKEITDLTKQLLQFDVSDYLDMDFYEDMMNDCEDKVVILGSEFPAGTALRKMDYHAFRESWLLYCDQVDPTEVWYYEELEEELKEKLLEFQKLSIKAID